MTDWQPMKDAWERLLPAAKEFMRALSESVDGTPVWEDDMGTNDHWLAFRVERTPGDEESSLDVTLKLIDSGDYDDGIYGEHGNLSMDLVEWGGAIVGGCTPYNYSDRVWVKYSDTDELAERLSLIADGAWQEAIEEWRAP